jgi:hypothetical protein
VNRIQKLVFAACLATACMSCGAPEARTTRDPARPLASPFPSLQKAVAVRDNYAVALFARLTPGATAPPMVTIRIDKRAKHVGEEIKMFVHGSGSDVVYAARSGVPAPAAPRQMTTANSAEVAIGSGVYPIDLRESAEVLPSLLTSYPPCPDCLIYFLCYCVATLYSVDLSVPAQSCPPVDPGRRCATPDL